MERFPIVFERPACEEEGDHVCYIGQLSVFFRNTDFESIPRPHDTIKAIIAQVKRLDMGCVKKRRYEMRRESLTKVIIMTSRSWLNQLVCSAKISVHLQPNDVILSTINVGFDHSGLTSQIWWPGQDHQTLFTQPTQDTDPSRMWFRDSQ